VPRSAATASDRERQLLAALDRLRASGERQRQALRRLERRATGPLPYQAY
jgi:hypothetical protein